jgi:PleD family two-component response regulator
MNAAESGSIAGSHAPSATTPWTTASIGVARISGGHDAVDTVMAAADRAMYHANGVGGDSVATEPNLHPTTRAFAAVGAEV